MRSFCRRFRLRGRWGARGSAAGCRACRARCLANLGRGESCFVDLNELPTDLVQKLFSLGLEKASRLEILSGGHHQPYLVKAGATRIVLDWDTVNRIPVKA